MNKTITATILFMTTLKSFAGLSSKTDLPLAPEQEIQSISNLENQFALTKLNVVKKVIDEISKLKHPDLDDSIYLIPYFSVLLEKNSISDSNKAKINNRIRSLLEHIAKQEIPDFDSDNLALSHLYALVFTLDSFGYVMKQENYELLSGYIERLLGAVSNNIASIDLSLKNVFALVSLLGMQNHFSDESRSYVFQIVNYLNQDLHFTADIGSISDLIKLIFLTNGFPELQGSFKQCLFDLLNRAENSYTDQFIQETTASGEILLYKKINLIKNTMEMLALDKSILDPEVRYRVTSYLQNLIDSLSNRPLLDYRYDSEIESMLFDLNTIGYIHASMADVGLTNQNILIKLLHMHLKDMIVAKSFDTRLISLMSSAKQKIMNMDVARYDVDIYFIANKIHQAFKLDLEELVVIPHDQVTSPIYYLCYILVLDCFKELYIDDLSSADLKIIQVATNKVLNELNQIDMSSVETEQLLVLLNLLTK